MLGTCSCSYGNCKASLFMYVVGKTLNNSVAMVHTSTSRDTGQHVSHVLASMAWHGMQENTALPGSKRCTDKTCLTCRTRFYRAELRGTAAWEHDLEQGTALGHPQLEASMSLGTAQSLGPHKSFASGLMRPEMSSSMKAWGSASFVMAPDGTPILPSATSIRPKAKVKHAPCPLTPLAAC